MKKNYKVTKIVTIKYNWEVEARNKNEAISITDDLGENVALDECPPVKYRVQLKTPILKLKESKQALRPRRSKEKRQGSALMLKSGKIIKQRKGTII